MYIERRQEEGPQKIAILHKVADIPGGVTVKTSGLTAPILPEATPLVPGQNGLWNPVATAVVVETAAADATTYTVKKGHLFIVGSKINKSGNTNVTVTAIDSSDPVKDIITVDATLAAKAVGAVLTEGGLGKPVAISGESLNIKKGENLFASAWVIAVVNSAIQPEPGSKPDGVYYVKN